MPHRESHRANLTSPDGGAIRAAQYVRMSTEHQKYSTENQADAIRKYADSRGLAIVRTYADHGKSGLRVDGRDALQRLIADVREGICDFTLILVYDVSRWGRFQDADESAYYEFICKEAGISVQYCAEQFENDGSLSATIIKGMKRAMAGEYSRELSAKVFAGQCRLIGLGFRQGGPAGYGLRRQLVDEQRAPKGELVRGLHKSIQTDRVILTLGPDDEVATVRRMYRLFVDSRMSEADIAEALNHEGRRTDLGRPWTRGTVHQVLTNEKYKGDNVYNRVSFKLKKKRVANPPDIWVRAEGVFAAIVPPEMFETARAIVQERSRRLSDDEMLARLDALRRETGILSGLVIDERADMPSSSAYRSRFGSLLRAYALVGYSSGRDYDYIDINRALRAMYPEIVQQSMTEITRLGGTLRQDPASELWTVNEEFTMSLVISRCLRTGTGRLRWKVRLEASLQPDITVALRMDEGNTDVLDCFVLPRLELPRATAMFLGGDNGLALDAYRFDGLEALFALAARSPVRSAA